MRTLRQKWLLDNRISAFIQTLNQKENIHIEPEQALNYIIKADPSLNHSASQWICECYIRDGFLWEDLKGGQTSKVSDTLNLFARYKKHLPVEQRNFYVYKTLSGLYQSVQSYHLIELEQQENSEELELGGRELKRWEKQKAYEQTHILFKNDQLKIIIPLSKESAQWWGKSTRWCTAADQNNQFDKYNQYAPLMILLFQDHSNQQRRLQLWINDNSIQWMDETDTEVKNDFVEQNWNIFEFVISYMFEQTGNALHYVPEKFKTEELCVRAVEQTGSALGYVPKHFKTEELCVKSVQKSGLALIYVPENLKLDKEVYIAACKNDGMALQYVPYKLRTQELCVKAVEQNGYALRFVPDNLRTVELCSIAIEKNSIALFYVPKELKTEELCLKAIRQDGEAIRFVPDNFITQELYIQAVEQSGYALYYVPKNLINYELCSKAVQQNGRALRFVPIKFVNAELCLTAVKQTGLALQIVPENLKTQELCSKAVQQDANALAYVPENLKHKIEGTGSKIISTKWNIEDVQDLFDKSQNLLDKLSEQRLYSPSIGK